ncbi:hypothetical protein RSAG8_05223, partial [Rhizoctonia solani AG-8 WAC10335]
MPSHPTTKRALVYVAHESHCCHFWAFDSREQSFDPSVERQYKGFCQEPVYSTANSSNDGIVIKAPTSAISDIAGIFSSTLRSIRTQIITRFT